MEKLVRDVYIQDMLNKADIISWKMEKLVKVGQRLQHAVYNDNPTEQSNSGVIP